MTTTPTSSRRPAGRAAGRPLKSPLPSLASLRPASSRQPRMRLSTVAC